MSSGILGTQVALSPHQLLDFEEPQRTHKMSARGQSIYLAAGMISVVLLATIQCSQAAPGKSCSSERLRNEMSQAKPEERSVLAAELFDYCQADFLANNQPSDVVRKSVDDWIGMDLSSANGYERFQAYQLALTQPRPENLPAELEGDCLKMYYSYSYFRENTEILSRYADTQSNEIPMEGDEKIGENDMKLMNYAQYSQLCSMLLD